MRGKNHETNFDTGIIIFLNEKNNNKKLSPLPPPMPQLFMGNTCNFYHHKQQKIKGLNKFLKDTGPGPVSIRNLLVLKIFLLVLNIGTKEIKFVEHKIYE